MGDISTNFSFYEVAKGYEPKGLPNQVRNNIIKLVSTILQPARELLKEPIHITSGYRSTAHNKAIGGASNSQHIYGTAVDLYINSKTGWESFLFFIENYKDQIGGIGLYADENIKGKFIHIDIRPKINGCITTWYFNGKNYISLPKKYQDILKTKGIRVI